MHRLDMHLPKIDINRPIQETSAKQVKSAADFRSILDVQFSKHASLRLDNRDINLTHDQMERVANGIGKASDKGIRDSLVLVDDVALLVNIKSRTVITAVQQSNDNVFSNIDGAVIV